MPIFVTKTQQKNGTIVRLNKQKNTMVMSNPFKDKKGVFMTTNTITLTMNQMNSMDAKALKSLKACGFSIVISDNDKSCSSSTTRTTKSAPKKSASKSSKKTTRRAPQKEEVKMTREERLTEKFGDIDVRKAYIQTKSEVSAELSAQIKARVAKGGKYLTKKQFSKALADITSAKSESKKSIKTLVKEYLNK